MTLNMPRSPTSSEDEMAQSFSDYSMESESDSSKEETIYDTIRATAERPTSRLEDIQTNTLVIRIVIPDLQQTKCIRFNPNATVWVAKQRILCTLNQGLKDVLNYGLYQPFSNGRDGKFLDEERLLREYPQPMNRGVPSLEFRYKKRLYKQSSIDEKQIAKLHTKASLRKFMDYIQHSSVEKINKMLDRGMDPNYHDPDNGETPLTLAAQLDNSIDVIKALRNSGAHLDFRSKDGMTAVHKAARAKIQATLVTLLELGSSSDYKDSRGLTPLYHTAMVGGDPYCCELLLHEHAMVGCKDENGWQEIHQACRYGHYQHLEHLLFYGANMGAQNASGNTALHICALYNQDSCARVLLFRGANKEIKNYNSQSPFQVAIIAGNFELAEFIKNHKEADIVPFREAPSYSRRRRGPQSTLAAPRVLLRSNSDNNLNVNNAPEWSAASASLHRSLSPQLVQQMQNNPNGTVKTIGSYAQVPRSRSPSLNRLGEDAKRQQHRHISPGANKDTVSVLDYQGPKRKLYSALPGRHFIVVKPYQPQGEGEIPLIKGDRIRVLSIGEGGFWEGNARGHVGWFPAECVEEVQPKPGDGRPETRTDRTKKLFRHYTVGSYDSFDASSDCIIEEKTVVLQKKDNEGFGFVLRGAKADTPIEEFNPTPAFPALQYLESVDEDGVAWQAGLRTGDFLIEVNNENVVKVGHRQVVNMIRQGGNHLVLKVVTVTRNLDPDDTARKKAPPPPKRAPTTALSLRSKSMTSELEELAVDKASVRKKKDVQLSDVECLKRRIVIRVALNKTEESGPMSKPLRPVDNVPLDSRIATIKQRPAGRCFPPAAETNSMYDRQGIAVMPPAAPGNQQGPFLGIPRGTMRRQKSIDSRITLSGITEEEKQFLAPPMLKFTRSLSMPDASEDIPPPPATLPPSPPPPSPFNSPKSPITRGYGTIKPMFTQNTGTKSPSPAIRSDNVGTIIRDKGMYFRHESDRFSLDSEDLYSASVSSQQNFVKKRGQMPENPYSEVGKLGNKGVFVPAKPARRKGMLVKQSNVEDSPEKTCSIPIPTIIIKEPSTSSSGKSSQGSSMETDLQTSEQGGQLRPDDSLNASSPFAAAIAGAVRDREKRLEARRNSPAFLSTDMGDESVGPTPSPRLRHSKSIDEGMFSHEESFKHVVAPSSLIINRSSNVFSNNESSHQGGLNHARPAPGKAQENNATIAKVISVSGSYMHPVTGKLLDPNSPLALALAARDKAIKEQSQPSPILTEIDKADLNKPLYIDTKLRPSPDNSFPATATLSSSRPTQRGVLKRQETESKHEPDPVKEEKHHEEKKNMLINIMDTSQQKTAGLLMVHTVDTTQADDVLHENEEADKEPSPENLSTKSPETPEESENTLPKTSDPALPAPPSKAIITVCSVDEPVLLPFRIPPPPFASIDVDEDFIFTEPLPPPLEFANSFDIPEDAAMMPPSTLADLLMQRKNGSVPPNMFHPNVASNSFEMRKPILMSNCLPASFMPHPESFDNVTDSGIEEVDSRSGSDHHLETTSTISTVSSISTLSSEGGENMDTCTVYADGQAFLVDKPPVPPKPKVKPIINKSNALYKDAVQEENIDSFVIPPPAPPPPPPIGMQPSIPKAGQQRTSKLWGDVTEVKSLVMPSPKASVISELNSILQQMNREKATKPGEGLESPTGMKIANLGTRGADTLSTVSGNRNTTVTFTIRPGANQPITLQNRTPEFDSRIAGMRRAPSPVVSPAEITRDIKPGPLSAPPASISDVFVLPSQPPTGDLFGMSMGRSRSPSPSILQQPISNKPFSAKPVHMWTKQDVADWLESLHLGEHKEMFMDNEIDGTHLPNLQKEDLIDLGVTRVGHRMNIERALKQLLDR